MELSKSVVQAVKDAFTSYINGNPLPMNTAIQLASILGAELIVADQTREFGLTVVQEPKYTVNEDGRLVNRATGVAIPDDEPVMIFRAKDAHARETIGRYVNMISESKSGKHHRDVCFERYQAFVNFADEHPERVREPDSAQ